MSSHVRIRRLQRELAAIEEELEAGEPRLASMFSIYNRLTRDERPARTEPLPRWAWRSWLVSPLWRQPWVAHAAMLLTLAAVVACGVAFTATMRPRFRPCVVFAAAGSPAAVPAVAGSAPGGAGAAGSASVVSVPGGPGAGHGAAAGLYSAVSDARPVRCPAYAPKK